MVWLKGDDRPELMEALICSGAQLHGVDLGRRLTTSHLQHGLLCPDPGGPRLSQTMEPFHGSDYCVSNPDRPHDHEGCFPLGGLAVHADMTRRMSQSCGTSRTNLLPSGGRR